MRILYDFHTYIWFVGLMQKFLPENYFFKKFRWFSTFYIFTISSHFTYWMSYAHLKTRVKSSDLVINASKYATCELTKYTVTRCRRNMVDSAFESWWFIFFTFEKMLVIRTHPEELHTSKSTSNTQLSKNFGPQWGQQMLAKFYLKWQGYSCDF